MSGSYRQVAIGEATPDAVTVGIEKDAAGAIKAAVWWDAVGDVDADEAEFTDVPEALAAAEASRALHGFGAVVIALQDGVEWQPAWGTLANGLTDDEAYELAAGIETESDA
ncbi:hypothetical protein SAMN05428969_2671 [Devosia sp. YR412]|uniref:hypothetical protein n=1 Tax=Devosia sp. YR412 TaxID=1881030 RepID=UPI0008CBB3A0|nr:hypothetical protein [Devosia sp. YR412]SEQ31144.1 hypothetical protein SAMN05428969_2671 [Devosia sp. YR412]